MINRMMHHVMCDDGGELVECFKRDGWGQVNVRTLPPGARTRPHRHPRTWEMWCLLSGQLQVHLEHDGLHRMVGGSVIAVPRGHGHWVRNDGEEDAVLVCRRDTIYDPENPDKEPWDVIG